MTAQGHRNIVITETSLGNTYSTPIYQEPASSRPGPSRNNSADSTAPALPRPSPSRSTSYAKLASGIWKFCKYGPYIPDSEERLNSIVPADPGKRKLPWQKWQ